MYLSALDENIKLKTFFLIKKVSFYLYNGEKKDSLLVPIYIGGIIDTRGGV